MEYSDNVKVWLTCPKTHAGKVRLAIGDARLGVIGNYSHCCVVTEGKGHFKPGAGATPSIGEVGIIEEVEEVIIEFVCHKDQLPTLKQILKDHHPYEEPAVEVSPLLKF